MAGGPDRPDWWSGVEGEIDGIVEGFSRRLEEKLTANFNPQAVLRRKNPYLFCLRKAEEADRFAESILSAYLSSSEETIFGDLLEDCSIAVCHHARGGSKSTTEGIDLEYAGSEDQGRVIVQVKSSENWGNSGQRKRLEENFRTASRIYRRGARQRVTCIEGICYGRARIRDRGFFYTYVGPSFWQEISGREETYLWLLEVIKRHAENGLRGSREQACRSIVDFLDEAKISRDGKVNWENLLRYVSTGAVD
ncbi:MAG: hypothetical protein MPJ52_01095 [Alphaproteobacteria bacterium]|nr:hypothetical protein [Alphaproteobacteria bacterium]